MNHPVERTPAGIATLVDAPVSRWIKSASDASTAMAARWFVLWRDDFGRWMGTPREDIDLNELEAERSRHRAGER